MKKQIELAKKQNLNWQTILIEEAQTDIKLAIKKYISGIESYSKVLKEVRKIINETIQDLESEELKIKSKQTLENYIKQLMQKAFLSIGIPLSLMMMAFSSLNTGTKFINIVKDFSIELPKEQKQQQRIFKIEPPTTFEIAQPTNVFSQEYAKRVKDVYSELAKTEPMYDKNISLRNIAEMTVRYDKTMEQIQGFINRGVNLVVSSMHANCSKRCEKWQGGHYTLDNTYQIVDNIQFEPLSNATDQYYTTKQGKVYKNGHITGYNCRHYLMEYKKGQRQIPVSAKVIEKQREIDHKMRYMERQIREWKDRALMHKGSDRKLFLEARQKAIQYNKKYIEFAKSNNRAYYPSRTDVF